MKRILLIGSGGAGKSTLARKISEKLGLPCVHLDRLFWKPGWVEPDRAEFRQKQLKFLKGKAWVIDGNYGATQELRLKYADTVLFLGLSRWICLWRVLKRYASFRGRHRPDMTPGCLERLDLVYLSWVWNYPQRGGRAALERLSKLGKSKRVVILRNPREVRSYLAGL
jgi:adenylate kinase family enzyme